jgi:hypothetical protein
MPTTRTSTSHSHEFSPRGIWGAFTPGIILYDKNNKHSTQHVLSNITTAFLPSHVLTDSIPGWYMFQPPNSIEPSNKLNAFPSFSEYLQSLLDHESLLLQHYEFLCNDVYNLCTIIFKIFLRFYWYLMAGLRLNAALTGGYNLQPRIPTRTRMHNAQQQ